MFFVAAIEGDVVLHDQVHRREVAGRLLAGEGAVQLVDQLPALHGQRLGHGRDLVLAGADALIGGLAAVAAGDVVRRAVRALPAR